MPKHVALGFKSLVELDNGKIDALVMTHLKRAAQDCIDRAIDKKPREVTITFKAEPIIDSDLECHECRTSISVKSKVPEYRSKDFIMKPTVGGFLFNEDFPDELDQNPLFDKDGENQE